MKEIKTESQPILLFDGVCNLCNSSVDFIIKRDLKHLKFASLQSEVGQRLLTQFNLSTDQFDSLVLIQNDKYYIESSAGLRVAKYLGTGWPLMQVFLMIPPFVRNGIYRWISRNRYKWFGKKESCRLPTPAERSRFLA